MTPVALVVMGISGVGKSTVGAAVAAELRWAFLDADDVHPESNIAKLTAGQPLSDADRFPWLDAVRDRIDEQTADGASVVVACSALRRAYRDVLREARADVHFVHLQSHAEQVAERLAQRQGHFMHPELLDSQVSLLESLESDEPGAMFATHREVAETVAAVSAWARSLDDPA